MTGHSVDEMLGRKIWPHDIEGCIERLGQGPCKRRLAMNTALDGFGDRAGSARAIRKMLSNDPDCDMQQDGMVDCKPGLWGILQSSILQAARSGA